MKKLPVRLNSQGIFPLVALTIIIFSLSVRMQDIPPLGRLLSPFTGVVQNNGDRRLDGDLAIPATGVSEPVHVYFDDRKVPHIFAGNAGDLYFAQGYVTASLRLWQMDFLSYASAGRLAELFGDDYVAYDRNQRRIGMLSSAARALTCIAKDKESWDALCAYTRGVNAYIRQLRYSQLPVEYKLLDYWPENWTNLKTVLVMKYMAATLTGYEEDLSMSHLMLALGEEKFNRLFPSFQIHATPVTGGSPSAADSAYRCKRPDYLNYSFLSAGQIVAPSAYNPSLGSNCWAVSGEKTRSGYPILANDPHLNLSLPSIWIEMQLSAPGLNVYGVTIPGAPAVLIGFNEDIAWGITNGADDVKDWYKLTIRDDYKQYFFDGKWRPLPYSIEEIKRRGQKPLYDTIYQALQGPVVSDKSFPGRRPELMNYALRWELHNPSDEFLCFIRLNKARNFADYQAAIRFCSCPSQNFTFACRDNTIAITHQGRLATKWPGQGRFVLDGTQPSHLYTSYIPQDSLPHVLNPSCHFVLSANNQPTHAGYPYYYNGYYSVTRANRIRQLLEGQDSLDLEKMEAMQMDNVNSFAVDAMPLLLGYLHGHDLDADGRERVRAMAAWNGGYGIDDKNACLFDLWWHNIKSYAWEGLKRLPFYSRPDDYVLLDMLKNDPRNSRFDKEDTPVREDAGDLVRQAFIQAVDSCRQLEKKGPLLWGARHKVNLMHPANIAAFSRLGLPSAGCPDAIDATSSGWGPSWRMVVQLGKRPTAFGIYAGGQSGEIGSRYYDSFVDRWNKGRYFPLRFFLTEEEAQAGRHNTWTFH